jgi:hypothetical protein
MKEQFLNIITEQIKRQGLSFVILAAVVWFFYDEVQEVKRDFAACNTQLIEMYSKHSLENREVILKNTQVIEEVKELIKSKNK